MSAGREWSSRPAPQAMSPEQLAALVDRSLARTDAMLFTATPTEELDEIGRWQQLKDQAFVGQMRAIVASVNRAAGHEREFAADEVGLAVGATTTTGGRLVQQALSLAALPGLLEAVAAGTLTERHALAVLGELDAVELALEQRQAVVLVVLARFDGHAPGDLRRLVRRLVVQVDRAAAAARAARASRGRRVWFTGDVDGQAVVTARGPAAAIAAIRASLEATLPVDPAPGDERARGEREFDLLVDLLTGGAEAGSWSATVVVPFTVGAGGDLELAEIPGLGAVLPSTARDLLDRCDSVSQVAVDPRGRVIGVGEPMCTSRAASTPARTAEPVLADAVLRRLTAPPATDLPAGTAYRFPPRLRRFLEARDQTCVFPGCNRPASAADKDHRLPWPAGPTSADNGQCLCRHHHRAKQAVFTVVLDDNGDVVWISRGGWRFRRHPKGY